MTPQESSHRLLKICQSNPVIPVVVVEEPGRAPPLVEALSKGGIHIVEITLRTEKALDAIRASCEHSSDCLIGAGTLLTATDVVKAKDAGAAFGVSPGTTPELIAACMDNDLPLLPGSVTPTEIMHLLDAGFDFQKFFPAAPMGGRKTLQAIAGPLPQVRFCPTGGVSPQNAASYLGLKNVVCVGGSWIAPPERVARGEFEAIKETARQAVQGLTVE